MKKRSYCAEKVNEVRWEEVADRVKERTVVWLPANWEATSNHLMALTSANELARTRALRSL